MLLLEKILFRGFVSIEVPLMCGLGSRIGVPR